MNDWKAQGICCREDEDPGREEITEAISETIKGGDIYGQADFGTVHRCLRADQGHGEGDPPAGEAAEDHRDRFGERIHAGFSLHAHHD